MMDVDGVILRARHGSHWSAALEADLGVSVPDLQRVFFSKHWNDVIVGRAGLEECLAPALETIAPHLSAADFIAYWFERDSALDEALLRELATIRAAGTQIHLATNQEHRRAAYLMTELGLARHVDAIHYSAALGCRKPEPEFFRAAAAGAKAEPRHLLLIDDTPANIEGARAAGWKGELWSEGSSITAIMNSHHS